MHLISAILVGVLFGCATYLFLQRSFIKMLFGFGLLGHGANLLVLSLSGSPLGKTLPIVENGIDHIVDPTPQALILTAIVIGFGVTSFLVVLLYRIYVESSLTALED